MPNRDDSTDKRAKGKSSSRRNAEKDLEPVHKPLYRHRRVHKVKHNSRNNDASGELTGRNGNNDSAVLPKKNSKRCIQKEIDKLVEENRILTMRLEGSDIDPEIFAELKEKDILMSRICNKYHKLLKDREELQQECEKLNVLLAEREAEYRQLHVHHKEFIEALQKAEKTKVNLLTFNQRFKSENVQLNEDVLLLKNVIYRLNAELERYQDKLRECGESVAIKDIKDILDSKGQANDINKVLESWGSVNIHVLGPLLDAYQESLSEKQELINKYEEDIANFGVRCKEVVAENESMQSEMDKLRSK